MNEPEIPRKRYLGLLLLVGLMGIISALFTFLFMVVVNGGIALVWEQAAAAVGLDERLFTLVICTVGGLLVGLLVKLFGDHNAIFSEIMLEFGKTGRFDYRNAPGIVVTALVSLVCGGSLGPEAPLADACGGIGTWLSDRVLPSKVLKENENRAMGFSGFSGMLAAMITNPFSGALLTLESAQGGASAGGMYLWGFIPSLLASATATVVFVGLTGRFFETLYAFPNYIPHLVDLAWAVPFGLAGALVGVFFMLGLRWLMSRFVMGLAIFVVVGQLNKLFGVPKLNAHAIAILVSAVFGGMIAGGSMSGPQATSRAT